MEAGPLEAVDRGKRNGFALVKLGPPLDAAPECALADLAGPPRSGCAGPVQARIIHDAVLVGSGTLTLPTHFAANLFDVLPLLFDVIRALRLDSAPKSSTSPTALHSTPPSHFLKQRPPPSINEPQLKNSCKPRWGPRYFSGSQ